MLARVETGLASRGDAQGEGLLAGEEWREWRIDRSARRVRRIDGERVQVVEVHDFVEARGEAGLLEDFAGGSLQGILPWVATARQRLQKAAALGDALEQEELVAAGPFAEHRHRNGFEIEDRLGRLALP